METPATAQAICCAAADGNLLAVNPGLATSIYGAGDRTPLWYAAFWGKEAAVRLLLEVAPEAALIADVEGWLPLHAAAHGNRAETVHLPLDAAPAALAADAADRHSLRLALIRLGEPHSTEAVRMLLEAAPAAAMTADAAGQLPLHKAAYYGKAEGMRLLLEAAPAAVQTADAAGRLPLHVAAIGGQTEGVRLLQNVAPATVLTADACGKLPLHLAAQLGRADAVRLLLEAAPASALTADARGCLPLHLAAQFGTADTVRLLLEAAPSAATTKNKNGELPLKCALFRMTVTDLEHVAKLEAARLLLSATPPEHALSALVIASRLSRDGNISLIANLAACTALSRAQWQRVPAHYPGLGAALPAVLARSTAEAALLVGRLPADERRRLRAGALCLGRAQRVLGVELPTALVGQVLALAAGP